jgi:proton-translocating NADH-quinone oxidoreductase chain N
MVDTESLVVVLPELLLVMFAVLLPAIGLGTKDSKILGFTALAGIVLAGVAPALQLLDERDAAFYPADSGLLVLDQFSALFMLIFLGVAFYVVLASIYFTKDDKHKPEYYSLILLAVTGMMIVASATDLFVLFVGIELTSLSSYALVAFRKKDVKGAEAATKYFIIGGLSSGFALFGISLMFGITGTTDFVLMNEWLLANPYPNDLVPVVWIAMIMIVVGFGFKIAMVPFHMWAPDVYEGAPTTITAMLAAGSKKMGFVALFKLLIAIMAVLTMTVGNILALNQTNIKRMLAYSSIAQAGYILIAIPVATDYALAGGIFQILTHAFMKGGAFLIVATLATVAVGESINSYKGLGKRSPFLALAMTIFLFSLAGIPPLAGFASKFFLFWAPIQAATNTGQDWLIWLSVAGIINSAISLFYYVRIVKYMYVEKGESEDRLVLSKTMLAAVAICVVLTVVIGVYPGPFYDACWNAAQALLSYSIPVP